MLCFAVDFLLFSMFYVRLLLILVVSTCYINVQSNFVYFCLCHLAFNHIGSNSLLYT